jgi:hypothetical protein
MVKIDGPDDLIMNLESPLEHFRGTGQLDPVIVTIMEMEMDVLANYIT